MTVNIDINSGFCFGVTSAIRKAEEELLRGPLYCLGDIVHNGQEVERLADMGLETIDYDDLRTLHRARVLFRAHGEPPSTYRIAHDNDIDIIDASCPVVLHLQQRIRDTYFRLETEREKAQIVIFGKPGHAEVIGLQGQTNDTAIVIEHLDEIDRIDFSKSIYLFAQTTKSIQDFQVLIEAINKRLTDLYPGDEQAARQRLHVADTICRNVAGRADKLRAFAQQHNVVIFVGGKKSSNATVLYQVCRQANPNTFFVSSPDELTPDILSCCSRAERVGICGATSTPLWLMEACKKAIEANAPMA